MIMSSPNGPTRVALTYLGCKVNQAEIEDLADALRDAGYAVVAPDDPADVCIVNSCTVTHVADRKTRLLVHQMARRNPGALVVVTGCFAAVDPSGAAAIDGTGLVVSNSDKPRLVEIVRQHRPPASAAVGTERPAARTRAMLKVQDGCDHHCTYCIVPAARGPVRSLSVEQALAIVRRRVAEGYNEVVLTGVALGSYGHDRGQPGALAELARAILGETALPRLRLSSIEPEFVTPALFALWSEPRLCRHLHLPLQSGCDTTLKRMGRRYRAADYAALLVQARAAAPDVAITTDLIVGFPGETDDEFAESMAFAEAQRFARMHVFRYSARRGTAATRLPGRVSELVKKQRAAEAATASETSAQRYRHSFVGSVRSVLWEEECPPPAGITSAGSAWWTGLTDNYIRVYTAADQSLRNRITAVRLLGPAADGLIAAIDIPA